MPRRTNGQRDRRTERQTDAANNRVVHKNGRTDEWMDGQTDKQTDIQTVRWTEEWTHRQVKRQKAYEWKER